MVDINHFPIIFPETPADSTQTSTPWPLQALALGALQAKTAAELRALEVDGTAAKPWENVGK